MRRSRNARYRPKFESCFARAASEYEKAYESGDKLIVIGVKSVFDGAGRTMPSLLADAINEKLFDLFGDTVLAFDGDTPEPVEDYIEELKGIV